MASRYGLGSFALAALVATSATVGGNLPAASADSRENGPIVISANVGSGWQLYRIDPDGHNLKQITNMPSTTFDAWFPLVARDGKRIAFTYGPQIYGATDVYVINMDGTGLRRLTHDGVSFEPAWSPDGRRLVFATFSLRTGRRAFLVSVPVDDPDKRTPLTDDLLNNYYGVYTPDGKHIVYNTEDGGVLSATWIMRVDGSDKRGLTQAPPAFCPGTVSNDSRRVLLQSHCNAIAPVRRSIWVMTLDDGDLRQLTKPPPGLMYDLTPAYSPDGTKIAFGSNRLNHSGIDLFTMNADGTGIKRIATGLTVGGCPDGNCVTPSWAVSQ